MLKKKIKYVNFDNKVVTEDLYFNVSKAELMKLNLKSNGTFKDDLTKVIDNGDSKKIVETFEEIILMSYGEKSSDGKRFVKSDEIKENFKNSAAFDELFTQLLSSEDGCALFVKAIFPKVETSKKTSKK